MFNVGIIGASGYTGLELIKIILNHPKFNINYLATTKGEVKLDILHPSLKNIYSTNIEKVNIDKIIELCDLVFLATPHTQSMILVKELMKSKIKIIDLSADYRLDVSTYEKYYCKHIDKDNIKLSTYGLVEFNREKIKNSQLIAVPGCYPTATLLALIPFIPYIETSSPIFIDAKSGISGAGKKLSETTSFMNINENIFAYNPLKHRHSPEIENVVKNICNKDIKIYFVPHLIPINRGELISIYASLKDENINPLNILKDFYKNEKFIRIRDEPVNVKNVVYSNFCDIFASNDKKGLFINSSIDNLLKGASSQAVVSANIMFNFDESLGIN